ncbi:MAG TPA: cbb3-type cytochrome c oxidase subunit I, partial [Chryseosolibacter sp.]|nr:cbb3-type cytochrome c oxidase subunit I [Chryseosolibacter sp.]
FTDFNVAHSHMTMYGIITFILWACVYAILPRITGREPKQAFVGVHFWLAFVGLFAYMISLMAGGTFKGLSWIAGNAFIDSVTLMKPYWIWRAIGGSLMFLSHLMFAYNFYVMIRKEEVVASPRVSSSSVKVKEYAELS